MSRGNFVILLMLIAAAAAGGGAVWFHHQQTKNVRELFTPERASQIAGADKAILRKLKTSSDFEERSAAQDYRDNEYDHWYQVVEQRDIGSARGFINFRAALLKDQSYEWNSVSGRHTSVPIFDYTVEFRHIHGNTVLYFDVDNETMVPNVNGRMSRTNPSVSIAPIADGLRKFFDEQFATPAALQSAAQPAAMQADEPAAKPAEN